MYIDRALLIKFRSSFHWNQAEMAAYIGITKRLYQEIERTGTVNKIDTFEKIKTKVLHENVSRATLLHENETAEGQNKGINVPGDPDETDTEYIKASLDILTKHLALLEHLFLNPPPTLGQAIEKIRNDTLLQFHSSRRQKEKK